MDTNENTPKKPLWKRRGLIAPVIAGVAGLIIGVSTSGGAAEPEKGPTYFADQAPAPTVTVTAEPEPAVTVTAEPTSGGTPESCLAFIDDAESVRSAAVEVIDVAAVIIGDIMPAAIEAAYLWDDATLDYLTGEIERETQRIVTAQGALPANYDKHLADCQAGK